MAGEAARCDVPQDLAPGILVERARRPSAVLISIKDYNERFVDRAADEERRAIVRRIEQVHLRTPRGRTSLDILRALRSGR